MSLHPAVVKQEKIQDGVKRKREIGSTLKFQRAEKFGSKSEQSVSFPKARNSCCIIPEREEGERESGGGGLL